MRLLYCFFYILLYTHITVSTEYIYPVASLDDATILYIHQLSPENIQLFEWNIVTNHTEQILWSLFNPAGMQLLPNNKGFSFIDNGRLRIKSFEKRTPKTIDFDEPIFNINGLQWLDEYSCYCSAFYNNYFSLFELHDDGSVFTLVDNDKVDCMYPQKINNLLFYIERKQNDKDNTHYSINQSLYKQPGAHTLVIDFGNKPLIFLQMLSETEGFVVEHQKNIDNDAGKANFYYHHLLKKNNTWQRSVLFSFQIPTYLFLYHNDQRIFESILPLLPRLINNKIYFVDCLSDNGDLELYYYDISTREKNKVSTEKHKGHIFVPIPVGRQLCCGGTKTGFDKSPLFVF